METTLKFDRVVLIKELNEKFCKIGEVFEVANILDNSLLLRDAKTRIAIGVISFSDFESHFVHEENFHGWTQWTPLTGFDGQTDAYYRTNRRKTQVKFLTDNVRGESFMNRNDEFNLYIGLNLAYLRARNKALAKHKAKYEEDLKKTNIELIDNEKIIEKIINSLPV